MVTAGCSGGIPFIDNSRQQTPTETQTTPTPTPADTSTSASQLYTAETNTGEIVLRLSDLGADYNASGETSKIRNELSEENRTEFKEKQIIKQHQRAFRLSNRDSLGEKPFVIFSSATVFESIIAAQSSLQNKTTSNISNATVSRVDIASNTVLRIKFQNERGVNTILYYDRNKNLVYSILVAGREKFYDKRAEELFVRTMVDIPQN